MTEPNTAAYKTLLEFPEDRCTLDTDCEAAAETTTVGWAGGIGWVYDACWTHAKRQVDVMTGWRLDD